MPHATPGRREDVDFSSLPQVLVVLKMLVGAAPRAWESIGCTFSTFVGWGSSVQEVCELVG